MKTAVLIDDDKDDLDILQDVIESFIDAACFNFSYPSDALHFLSTRSEPVDFIFVDYNMPKMNGEEVLKEIRRRVSYNESIVAILSTSMDDSTMSRLVSNGANYAFPKAVTFRDFERNIHEVLKGRVRSIL
ncbi:response regulator [Chryseolinea soli]|uniref:Response regulator n=1 Tax=Chryseolinea soli TaxID=2321403 RepID=A0A385SYE6_9BACT|nr:response regulator [Chryseolinea soli]AYB34760.1 response regulator [Chryseolinea soli]